jgi:hypothetical protein
MECHARSKSISCPKTTGVAQTSPIQLIVAMSMGRL